MPEVQTEKVLENFAQSGMSPFDEEALQQLLVGKEHLRILEIGSWMGAGSTQILARHADQLVCVDHWQGNENPGHRHICEILDPYAIFLSNTAMFRERIITIRADSIVGLSILADTQFDFIFIDGDHRYRHTRQDIRNSLPKLRQGGMLAGHDCEGRLSQLPGFSAEELEKDHIDSPIPSFRHCHPGVIVAVAEAFADDVMLFADTPNRITLPDGSCGYSTIWHITPA